MALLEVVDVSAGYANGPDILSGLTLAIEEGRSTCIIGPNGAGKSTLLRTICGLLPARRGSIAFKGERLDGLPCHRILKRGISLVPQDHSLFGDMTVKENVRMGGYILDDRREVERRIEEVFAMFPRLGERASQAAKTLSGGEQQMLALGRTMVLRPEIVMLDEPSLGLAPMIARQIFDTVGRLRQAGMTVVLVEQNARMGLDFAEWGCVLDLGRMVFEGPSRDVLADPRIEELYLGRRGHRRGGAGVINLVQILILGLALGGVYALMASGLTLIFGVMGIVNLAHASFMVLAAFMSYWAFTRLGIDPILSIPAVMAVMFGVGIVVYRLIFARGQGGIRQGATTVLITFALALVVEGTLGFAFSNIYRSTTPDYASRSIIIEPFYLPEAQFYATLASSLILVLLWAFLAYTRTGYAIRATMHNRTAAQVVGVDVDRISMLVFGIGMALAGASGAMLSFLFSFYPSKHWEWVAILLSLVVLGGMGSLIGALVGALALAVGAAYVGSFLGPTWSPVTFYLALFVILLVRPQGLLGRKPEM